MSAKASYYLPPDEILRELGRLQVLHGHLDHTLRLAVKRLLGISIDDPGYWTETRGMSAALRDRVRELIAVKYANDEDMADTLNKVLDDAEAATTLRNRALHSVWMKPSGSGPVLYDRDKQLKTHVHYRIPTVGDLDEICKQIETARGVLDALTSGQLKLERVPPMDPPDV